MEKITVSKIIGEYPANYGQVRVAFSTNEYGEKSMSGFFKSAPKVGETLEGDITVKNVGGKEYTNFVLPKAPRGNYGATGAGSVGSQDIQKIMDALRMSYREITAAKTEALTTRQLVQLLTKRLEVKGVLDVIEDRTSAGTKVPFTDAKEQTQQDIDRLWNEVGDSLKS